MVEDLDNPLNDLGGLGESVRAMRRRLKEGGPAVDKVLLLAYIDGHLPHDKKELVRRAVATWRTWHDVWCGMRALSNNEALGPAPPPGPRPPTPREFTARVLACYPGQDFPPDGPHLERLQRGLARAWSVLFFRFNRQLQQETDREDVLLEVAALVSMLPPDPPGLGCAFKAVCAVLAFMNLQPGSTDGGSRRPLEDEFYRHARVGTELSPDGQMRLAHLLLREFRFGQGVDVSPVARPPVQ